MRIRRVAWIAPAAVAAAAAFVLSACAAETASPSEIRTRISAHVPPLVDEAAAAGDGADASLGALGQGKGALGALMPGLVPEEAAAVFGVARLARLPADGDTPTGAEVADELNTRLFSDANHLGDGVFAIPTDLLCPVADDATAPDPDCVAQAERAQLCVRAELAGGDGLDFTLVVGGDRAEPVGVELRAGFVGVSIDLAEVAAAAIELGLVDAGTTIELDGVISARFEIIAPAHVSAAITIDRAIHVAVTSATDPAGDVRLDTAVAHPLARLELDGSAADGGLGTAQLGLGATQVRLAADTATGAPARDLDLPGVSAMIRLGAGQLLVERFSLGSRATTVMVGDQLGARLDLNPDTGRALDLAVTGDATDAAFAFVPGLDLRLAIDHTVLGTAAPIYDVDRVVIDGAPLPTLRARTTTAGTAQLEVVAGELTIGTTPAGYGATIAAGECVGAEDRSGAAGDYTVPVPVACEL